MPPRAARPRRRTHLHWTDQLRLDLLTEALRKSGPQPCARCGRPLRAEDRPALDGDGLTHHGCAQRATQP